MRHEATFITPALVPKPLRLGLSLGLAAGLLAAIRVATGAIPSSSGAYLPIGGHFSFPTCGQDPTVWLRAGGATNLPSGLIGLRSAV